MASKVYFLSWICDELKGLVNRDIIHRMNDTMMHRMMDPDIMTVLETGSADSRFNKF